MDCVPANLCAEEALKLARETLRVELAVDTSIERRHTDTVSLSHNVIQTKRSSCHTDMEHKLRGPRVILTWSGNDLL